MLLRSRVCSHLPLSWGGGGLRGGEATDEGEEGGAARTQRAEDPPISHTVWVLSASLSCSDPGRSAPVPPAPRSPSCSFPTVKNPPRAPFARPPLPTPSRPQALTHSTGRSIALDGSDGDGVGRSPRSGPPRQFVRCPLAHRRQPGAPRARRRAGARARCPPDGRVAGRGRGTAGDPAPPRGRDAARRRRRRRSRRCRRLSEEGALAQAPTWVERADPSAQSCESCVSVVSVVESDAPACPSQFLELRREMEAQRAETEKAIRELRQARTQLRQAEQEREQFQQDLERVRTEREALRTQVAELREWEGRRAASLEALRHRLDQQSRAREAAAASVVALREQLAASDAELKALRARSVGLDAAKAELQHVKRATKVRLTPDSLSSFPFPFLPSSFHSSLSLLPFIPSSHAISWSRSARSK